MRSRASPFSAGTVNISVRASNAARAPVGEMAALMMLRATLTCRGRSTGTSALIRTLTGRAVPDATSKTCKWPNCS